MKGPEPLPDKTLSHTLPLSPIHPLAHPPNRGLGLKLSLNSLFITKFIIIYKAFNIILQM